LIQFPGWDDDPGKEYQRSRVYLQTSSKEALGLSVVDAVRHGLPCVVADVGGLPEVVLDNVNGFVVSPGDVAAASEAVRELLLNDSTWLKMSKSANEVYRERFTPEMWKENMLAAHES
jgi:glycosyltransferase involved in cell wall biosynthesis